MKTDQRWVCAICLVVAWSAISTGAEESAVVKKNRVNVRAQALPTSEVITQLKKGETVVVLEEITARKPKRGEPAKWAKIQLPPNTPVWVYAPYIETTNNTVNIKRLNLRAGPGERFSVIGRLERGTPVKQIRTTDNWMEIEAPPNAYAFVAAEMLEKSAAPAPTELAANTPNVAPNQPPPTVETVKPDTAPAVATEPVPAPTQAAQPPAQPPVLAPAPAATTTVEAAAPKRVVSREGLVVVSRSIQAPTSYALEHRESRRIVNYLHSESEDINLKRFAGRKVIVTGEELIDHRWVNTPIVEVESIRLVP
jgi:SH3-like domain-containing protein